MYVASDGKEFTDEQDCAVQEMTIAGIEKPTGSSSRDICLWVYRYRFILLRILQQCVPEESPATPPGDIEPKAL